MWPTRTAAGTAKARSAAWSQLTPPCHFAGILGKHCWTCTDISVGKYRCRICGQHLRRNSFCLAFIIARGRRVRRGVGGSWRLEAKEPTPSWRKEGERMTSFPGFSFFCFWVGHGAAAKRRLSYKPTPVHASRSRTAHAPLSSIPYRSRPSTPFVTKQ